MKPIFNPPTGFRDLYPKDKQIQDYLFTKLKNIANLFGFSSYDGPILEDINIYLNKTSAELLERQTFAVKTKDERLIMRPEMTPTLARMIANKANQLNFPLKLFNLGLRFRYESPQKGRAREFYQADFDIIGANSLLADAEIINVAVSIFKDLGAKTNDFVVYLNSRKEMEKDLNQLGFRPDQFPAIFNLIDKKDKLSPTNFNQIFSSIEKNQKKINKLLDLLANNQKNNSDYFKKLFYILEKLGISQYCQINYQIVRGLDYYTGLVFEIWEPEKKIRRALLGGGRYDNLISQFNPTKKITGVGFATSDIILLEFLKTKNLLPPTTSSTPKVLVTIFNPQLIDQSLTVLSSLRKAGIAADIFLEEKKLDKQLKYADKNEIRYVIIIGPEEAEKKIIKLKDLKTGAQKEVDLEELLKILYL